MAPSYDWWSERKDDLTALMQGRESLYVYNEETFNEILFDLLSIEAVDGLYYPVKANPNVKMLKKVYDLDAGFMCVSSVEINYLLQHLPRATPRILFMPEFTAPEDYELAFNCGATIILSSILPVKTWPNIFQDRVIFVSINIETDDSAHKTGIGFDDIKSVANILTNFDVKVSGLHIQSKKRTGQFPDTTKILPSLEKIPKYFPDADILCMGRGMGIILNQDKGTLDIDATWHSLTDIRDIYPDYQLWFEPGNPLISHAGVLLTRVTEAKLKGEICSVIINDGMEILAGSVCYGSHHEIVNLSGSDENQGKLIHIIGSDTNYDNTICCIKKISPVKKGNILLISNAGAYSPDTLLKSQLRNPDSEQYLQARRMCQVKL
ncbi:MAG: hypothetical protein J7L16_02150 [Deltaproteobacteria bacterium]|nr:hypothetical protein [Deltaproteobacteria bacterium]